MLRSVGLLTGVGFPGSEYVGPGFLLPPLVLTRGQVGAVSTAQTANGSTWQEFGPDIPRFNGLARRLLIEGQRSRGIRNPRGEGVAGNLLPTHWTQFFGANAGTVTRTVTPLGLVQGRDTVRITFSGTATGPAGSGLYFDNVVSAAPGQQWTLSAFIANLSASNVSIVRLIIIERLATTYVRQINGANFVGVSNPDRPIVTGTTGAGIDNVLPTLDITIPAAGPWSVAFDVSWPQIEQGGFASTPILPPVGAPAASTRGADIVTAPLASLGIGGSGAGTYLWTSRHTETAGNNFWETLFSVSDGTLANRFAVVRVTQSSNAVRLLRQIGGVDQSAFAGFTPGSMTRWGLSLDGTGRAALSIDGGAPIAVTGGPTTGLTTQHIGSMPDGVLEMFGEYGTVRVIPGAVSDATLQSLVAGLPI